jgi:hypothetical protein
VTNEGTEQKSYHDHSKTASIDVRSNPAEALAHYKAELKAFSDPVFSPEIEQQVRAEAAVGKERNRLQREAIFCKIDGSAGLPQSTSDAEQNVTLQRGSGKATHDFINDTLTPPLQSQVSGSQSQISEHNYLKPFTVFTSIFHTAPSTETAKNTAQNPYNTTGAQEKNIQFLPHST